jgi:2-C-methyl-D-erythritol 4-phosphate cytidylyltransferase/2-C-methyl-D-erythritol 2,4-cyclodiphosphate synthase
MSVAVVIVAAGRGERLGSSRPKQLLDLAGRTMLQRSVAAFDVHPAVRSLVVVLPGELVAEGASHVGPTTRPCRCVAGGVRRQDSVGRGLAAVEADAEFVLVHDAARPFVSRALIDRVLAAAAAEGAAVPALPVHETVKRAAPGGRFVAGTIARGEIWLAQTPQGFRRTVLETAVAAGRTTEATDEAMLVERAGLPVAIVDGDTRNFKITTADDLARARAALSGALRVGTGYDLHRLVEGRPLVLAGVRLPSDRGPAGHSDGDVVSHALIDALFGAAAAGDIGGHFPDTDARWKGASGLDLLARAVAALDAQGWVVANADVTVMLERPKVAPHVPAIRDALAGVLGVPAAQVSVKAKTNEGADAVGRGEAIAAHAVALIAAGAGR